MSYPQRQQVSTPNLAVLAALLGQAPEKFVDRLTDHRALTHILPTDRTYHLEVAAPQHGLHAGRFVVRLCQGEETTCTTMLIDPQGWVSFVGPGRFFSGPLLLRDTTYWLLTAAQQLTGADWVATLRRLLKAAINRHYGNQRKLSIFRPRPHLRVITGGRA